MPIYPSDTYNQAVSGSNTNGHGVAAQDNVATHLEYKDTVRTQDARGPYPTDAIIGTEDTGLAFTGAGNVAVTTNGAPTDTLGDFCTQSSGTLNGGVLKTLSDEITNVVTALNNLSSNAGGATQITRNQDFVAAMEAIKIYHADSNAQNTAFHLKRLADQINKIDTVNAPVAGIYPTGKLTQGL